jgi:hypothetical protein
LRWVLYCLLLPSTAMADGIDSGWLLTRIGGWDRKPLLALLLFVGLMAINYGLNLAVIGVPAANAVDRPRFWFGRDLIWYTVLAQVVDRLGFILSLTIGTTVAAIFNSKLEIALSRGILGGLAFNFLLSGLGIATLSEFFVKSRWRIPPPSARRIAVRAGIFTNPTWFIALSLAISALLRR